jgi:hypothetical protein
MEGRRRRSFTDDYKRQAVDLIASSGRSIGSVAKELGLRGAACGQTVALVSVVPTCRIRSRKSWASSKFADASGLPRAPARC